ncbi:MAG: tetratricopeptide repeat protein, partial [Candidatus Nealsonbacteria bacterium]|nr:tetratricopeptide repeat protein [Candidatus Nealsonbacteria bacterium]
MKLCHPRFCAILLLALQFSSTFVVAAEDSPPADHQKQLEERDKYDQQANAFLFEGKTSDAQTAAQKALKIERQVYGDVHDEIAVSLSELATLYTVGGDFAAAKDARQGSLSIIVQLHGEKHWQAVDARWALKNDQASAKMSPADRRRYLDTLRQALEFRQAGNPKQAIEFAREFCQLTEGLLGKNNPWHATALCRVASLSTEVGDLTAAELYYRDAVQIYAKTLGESHPTRANTLNTLAGLLFGRHEYAQARQRFEQALAMQRRLYPEDKHPLGHHVVARSLYGLGRVLYEQAEFRQAEKHYEESLAMRRHLYPESQYPQGHLELVANLYSLADAQLAQRSYNKAKEGFQQAFDMLLRLYPQGQYPQTFLHPATVLNRLGGTLSLEGDHESAQKHIERALAMFEDLYPQDQYPSGHPKMAESLYHLGTVLEAQGKHREAQERLEHATAMLERTWPDGAFPQGKKKHAMAQIHSALGYGFVSQGRCELARGSHERALAMRQSLYTKEEFPRGHPEIAESLNNLAVALSAQGEFGQARQRFEEALAMHRGMSHLLLKLPVVSWEVTLP